MIEGTLREVAHIVGGKLHGDNAGFSGISTDTRKMRGDELFVALRGPNFDGNCFVSQAAICEAAGAIVEDVDPCGLPQVLVDDALAALGRLAHHWRRRFGPRLVAITGSNGKTTVKQLVAAVLEQQGSTLATEGNLNNEIGVPLTLTRLDHTHDFAVIEMGANHAGEIARLTAMAAPSVGLVTNAGPAHLEGFGSLDGVASAKGELFEGLRRHAIAIINRDDRFYPTWRQMTRTREVVTFGHHEKADIRVLDAVQHTNGHGDGLRVALSTPDGDCSLRLRLPGQHNAMNAAAATAVCLAAGVDLETITRGLQRVTPVRGRLSIRRAQHGARVIDDTYNANPASVQAALDLLAAQPGTAWLVLGDMGELGANAQQLHALIGTRAREAGVERLFTVGPLSAAAADSFGHGAERFDDPDELIDTLRNELRQGVTVLIKASRSMRLEQISDALSEEVDD